MLRSMPCTLHGHAFSGGQALERLEPGGMPGAGSQQNPARARAPRFVVLRSSLFLFNNLFVYLLERREPPICLTPPGVALICVLCICLASHAAAFQEARGLRLCVLVKEKIKEKTPPIP
jgi:hypothetical protein